MDELIVQHLRGETTEFEERRLSLWRASSPQNELEFLRVQEVWTRLGEWDQAEAGPVPSVQRMVREGDRRRRHGLERSRVFRPVVLPLGVGLAAAAALFFVFVGWPPANDLSTRTSNANPGLTSTGSHSSARDVTTLSLSDGSVVRLAPDTRIEFLPSSGGREVALNGKAFFAVARSEAPFVVRTPTGVVTVLGTRFEVQVGPGSLRVVVLEGRVRLEGRGGAVSVVQGQAAFLSEGSTPRVTDMDDVFTLLNWPDGLLVFRDTPFGNVAREVERHFGREVRIVDADLRDRRITAWFADEPLEEVVSALCMVAAARCRVNDSLITFER